MNFFTVIPPRNKFDWAPLMLCNLQVAREAEFLSLGVDTPNKQGRQKRGWETEAQGRWSELSKVMQQVSAKAGSRTHAASSCSHALYPWGRLGQNNLRDKELLSHSSWHHEVLQLVQIKHSQIKGNWASVIFWFDSSLFLHISNVRKILYHLN